MTELYRYNDHKSSFKFSRIFYYLSALFQLISAMTLTGLITLLQKGGFTVKIYPRKEIPNIGLLFAYRNG
ncbi:hypothetical protein A3D77_00345 [Candidatus Gottesmanbacteria bacterium RIFCSPHIGHO2_02_FULL_39_11]|uniref:Uncharacterized protein n=1 Tax=Candidatus Gottesmanbacteria bacterium RIFCSPHIGHO2_02_FULL_39_11 TaxID=1798382 RepID=A0A1F5ZM33_9BACT|nr:MAG: hypothetical protein A3D77_00345 [Candidatus Gottesmanbacteria bacterium RIFCSPHIGHO2_02_FULL_39_11]